MIDIIPFYCKKICLKEGEVWWKNCSNVNFIVMFVHMVCHLLSSAIPLQKFTVFIEMKPPYPPTLIMLKIPEFINNTMYFLSAQPDSSVLPVFDQFVNDGVVKDSFSMQLCGSSEIEFSSEPTVAGTMVRLLLKECSALLRVCSNDRIPE